MKTTLLAAALAILAAGCAAPEADTGTVARDSDYRTGSNIPRKGKDGVNRVETVSKEELERSRAGIVNSAPLDPR